LICGEGFAKQNLSFGILDGKGKKVGE